MPYRMGWLVENHILYIKLIGSLEAAEQQGFFKAINDLCQPSPQHIHLIVDMTHQTERLTIRDATQMALKHPMPRNVGWVIQVGNVEKPQIFLSSLIAQFFQVHLYAVHELDEAFSYLRFRDVTIDWGIADYSILNDADHSSCAD